MSEGERKQAQIREQCALSSLPSSTVHQYGDLSLSLSHTHKTKLWRRWFFQLTDCNCQEGSTSPSRHSVTVAHTCVLLLLQLWLLLLLLRNVSQKRGENGREKRGRNGMEAENAVRRESTVPAHHQHFIDVRMM